MKSETRESIERWLTDRGVSFAYIAELELSGIDREASLRNQARLVALDENVIERYAADMERGDEFPPLLVRTKTTTKGVTRLITLGGNHRSAACNRIGRRKHPAFLLDITDDMARRLMYEDNRRHGLPPSDEERAFQAVHLIEAGGETPESAAKLVGLTLAKVNGALGAARADERAKELNLPNWPALSRTTRWRLSFITSDAVFAAVAEYVATNRVRTQDVFEVVTKLNTMPDEDALGLIGILEDEASNVEQASRVQASRQRLYAALLELEHAKPEAIVRTCGSAEDRQGLVDRVMAAAATMRKIVEAVEKKAAAT